MSEAERLHRHLIGQQGSRLSLNTPALVLDLDMLDRNIAEMARFAREHNVGLRPHSKTHKSADIARRQIKAGALGLHFWLPLAHPAAPVPASAVAEMEWPVRVVRPANTAPKMKLFHENMNARIVATMIPGRWPGTGRSRAVPAPARAGRGSRW